VREGHNYLRIVQRLSSTFLDNALSNSHILPMVLELHFQDITLGFFQFHMYHVLTATGKSTVEDAVYMILESLEINYFLGR